MSIDRPLPPLSTARHSTVLIRSAESATLDRAGVWGGLAVHKRSQCAEIGSCCIVSGFLLICRVRRGWVLSVLCGRWRKCSEAVVGWCWALYWCWLWCQPPLDAPIRTLNPSPAPLSLNSRQPASTVTSEAQNEWVERLYCWTRLEWVTSWQWM